MIRQLRMPILFLLAGLTGCLALAPAGRQVDLGELRLEATRDLELEPGTGRVRATGEDPGLTLLRIPAGPGRFRPSAIGLELEIGFEVDPGDSGWKLSYVPTAQPGAEFQPRNVVMARTESRASGKILHFELPEPATRLRLDPPAGSAFTLRSLTFEEMPSGWRETLQTASGVAAVAGLVLLLLGWWLIRHPVVAEDHRTASPAGEILLAVLLGSVVLQIGTMILTSKYNAHPDERLHVATAEYYVRWWIPPAVGDPRVIPSFSRYGATYHADTGAVYFLAGKAVAPVERLVRPHFRAFRLLNLGLFTFLAASALLRGGRMTALFLLLLPAQFWYVFSYFNADALALFACFLCGWQMMDGGAAFARFLSAEGWKSAWHGPFLFAFLAAILLLSKQNYHVFLIFLAGNAAWQIATSDDRRRSRTLALKWGLVALLMLGFAWPRFAIDRWVNDPARSPFYRGLAKWDIAREQAERYAEPGFRPSEHGTEGAFQTSQLKQRGVAFGELFTEHRWHELSFESFVGVYGYMTYFSSTGFYLTILIVYAALLVTLGVWVWRHGTAADRWFGCVVALYCLGFVLLSANYSWTVDFQAQGRYLFPLFGILFIAVLKFRALIPQRILWPYALVIWLLSSYSFIFTGLRMIPKFVS